MFAKGKVKFCEFLTHGYQVVKQRHNFSVKEGEWSISSLCICVYLISSSWIQDWVEKKKQSFKEGIPIYYFINSLNILNETHP